MFVSLFLDGIMVVATEGDGRYLAAWFVDTQNFVPLVERTQQLVSHVKCTFAA